ncbi:hypothetical protein Ddc_20665 [Ditylenchus destructor]|nr:hypothetical protein Ddc_20665 [Ditylenchus destructor]
MGLLDVMTFGLVYVVKRGIDMLFGTSNKTEYAQATGFPICPVDGRSSCFKPSNAITMRALKSNQPYHSTNPRL